MIEVTRKFKALSRQQEYLIERILIQQHFKNSKINLAHHPNGAPFLTNSEEHISISHTRKYVAVALGHAMQALQFIKLLPRTERGMRKFCLLAAEMAVMTLRNIHENPLFREPKEIKISHSDVRNCVFMTFFCASSNLLLDLLFSHLSGKEMKPEFRDPAELMNKVSFWNSNNAYEYKPVQNDPSSK